MALVIRLRQQGRANRQFFRLVVADERSPRDGKYLEKLGWYDPKAESGKNIAIDQEKLKHWIEMGAQPSERAQALFAKSAPEVLETFKAKKTKKAEKKRLQRKKK